MNAVEGGGFSDAADNIRPRPTDLQDDWEVCPICIPRRTVESFPRPRRPIRPTDFCISPHPAVSSACAGAYRLVGVRSAGAAGRLHPGTPAFVHSLAAVLGYPGLWGGRSVRWGLPPAVRRMRETEPEPEPRTGAGEGGDSGGRGRAFATTDAECEFFLKRKFCIFEKLS